MAKKISPAKQASGGARLKAAGKIPMTLGWHLDQIKKIRQAAESEGIHATQFVMRSALRDAEKFSRKSGNSS